MPSFHQVKILPYNPKDLFNLVLDVESYPQFIPWCTAAKIISRNQDIMVVELTIKMAGFLEKYQSKITSGIIDEHSYFIEVQAISGPFKYLKNSWQFLQENSDTRVEFFIDFSMKFSMLNTLVSVFFTDATKQMINAFEKRAERMLSKTTEHI